MTITIRKIVLAVVAPLALAAVPSLAAAEEEPIRDNSFLVEEAYNQEAGVIQHISTFTRGRDGGWVASFTEEWPVLGETHQASVTFTGARVEGFTSGLGDVALNYRYQAVDSDSLHLAVAPRLSVILPTGDSARALGSDTTGLQINVPLSWQPFAYLVTHLNAGGTWLPSARDPAGARGTLALFSGGGSVIALLHQNFNVMLETLYTKSAHALPGGTVRSETLTLNPGVRGAINFASGLQIVPGLAVPIGVGPSRGERGVFLYLSFEHPFWLAGPTAEPKKI